MASNAAPAYTPDPSDDRPPQEKVTLYLIRKAKEGDREAWGALCDRYYPEWLNQFHGKLGRDLRQLHDTNDIVQSAIGDALRDIKDLRQEAMFFAWVCVIVRNKIAAKRRRFKKKKPPSEEEKKKEEEAKSSGPSAKAMTEEAYLKLLDAMSRLFKIYPEPMTTIYLKYFEEMTTEQLMAALELSERQVYRLLEQGRALLRQELGEDAGI